MYEQPVSLILNLTHGCNMRCPYCYYAHDMCQAPGEIRPELIETIIKRVADSRYEKITFIFHGGEPLLRGSELFKKILFWEKIYLSKKKWKNKIQTNGTLIDEKIIKLIGKNRNFELCISLDGPEAIHDQNRVFADRKGTHATIMRKISLLSANRIPVKILSVISDSYLNATKEIYEFYRKIKGLTAIDFLLPERSEHSSLLPKGYLSRILINLFRLWYNDQECAFLVRIFYSLINQFLGFPPLLCSFFPNCLRDFPVISIDIEGTVTPCDNSTHLKLGNINHNELEFFFTKSKLRKAFSLSEEERLRACSSCQWFTICHGGCPNHQHSEGDTNYYCEDLKKVFSMIKKTLEKDGILYQGRVQLENLANIPNPVLRNHLTTELSINIVHVLSNSVHLG